MVKFIADLGGNHNGDFKRVYDWTLTAGDIGCWAIKPQFYDADKLFRDPSSIPKEWEFKYEWFPELRKLCTHLGLKLGVSVFDVKSVEMVKPYVDFLKISSFDIMRLDLIEACILTKLPVFISIGLANEQTIRDIMRYFSHETEQIKLFHCVSEYPAKVSHCNVHRIYGKIKGYSDHSKSPGVIHRAVGQGAEYIEFHMDLNGQGWEQMKDNSCWLPSKMANVIYEVRQGEEAMQEYEFPEEYYLKKADSEDGLRPMLNGK